MRTLHYLFLTGGERKRAAELNSRLRDLKIDPASVAFLPVMARGDWVALLDRGGSIVGFLPVDGFFR